MKKKLNVFFAIGPFFIKYFSVAVTSLLETNKNLDLSIYLIYDFEDLTVLNQVVSFAREKYGVDINLIFQDTSLFDHYRIAGHVSKNTYVRLLLPEILPSYVETGLFLDSDIVVTGCLDELLDLKFAEFDDTASAEDRKYIYAVPETKLFNKVNSERITSLGYPINQYFNAGIIWVNLKNWRLKRLSSTLINMASKHMNDLKYWDQDILNMYFANRWSKLDRKFNSVHLIWKRRQVPLVIHFAGASKPWHYLNLHPYKKVYLKYQSLIPLNHKRYEDFSSDKIPLKTFRVVKHFLNYFRQLYLGKLYD